MISRGKIFEIHLDSLELIEQVIFEPNL